MKYLLQQWLLVLALYLPIAAPAQVAAKDTTAARIAGLASMAQAEELDRLLGALPDRTPYQADVNEAMHLMSLRGNSHALALLHARGFPITFELVSMALYSMDAATIELVLHASNTDHAALRTLDLAVESVVNALRDQDEAEWLKLMKLGVFDARCTYNQRAPNQGLAYPETCAQLLTKALLDDPFILNGARATRVLQLLGQLRTLPTFQAALGPEQYIFGAYFDPAGTQPLLQAMGLPPPQPLPQSELLSLEEQALWLAPPGQKYTEKLESASGYHLELDTQGQFRMTLHGVQSSNQAHGTWHLTKARDKMFLSSKGPTRRQQLFAVKRYTQYESGPDNGRAINIEFEMPESRLSDFAMLMEFYGQTGAIHRMQVNSHQAASFTLPDQLQSFAYGWPGTQKMAFPFPVPPVKRLKSITLALNPTAVETPDEIAFNALIMVDGKGFRLVDQYRHEFKYAK